MIGSTGNFVPDIIVSIYNSFRSGDLKSAYSYQQKLNRIIKDILGFGVIPGIKEILNMAGFECGKPRRPFKALDEDDRVRLSSLIKEWGIKLFS
jgi:N-acetylneuraminate lyase